jgi:DNA polymerase III epsilon subunit-like protein
MGVAVNGDSELIRVTLIDYFSGRSLIDSLVFPNQAMQHLSTKFSGVSFQQLNKAKRDGKAIKGVEAARQQVWRFVGPETTVVAHGGISDFTALRWIHGRILDTVLLEPQSLEERQRRIEQQEGQKKKQEGHAALKDPKNPTLNASAQGKAAGRANTMAMDSTSAHLETDNLVDLGIASASTDNAHQNSTISQPLTSSQPSFSNNSNAKREQNNKRSRGPKAPGTRSLKALAKTKLHRDIQTSKDGHDSLEDALAARDLADWAVTNNAASIEEVFKEQVEFEKSMQEKYGSKEERKEARSAQRWKDKIAEATRKDTAEKEKTAASSVPKVVEWRGLGMEDWNKESATRGGQYAAGPRAPNVLLYQGAPGIQGAGAGNGYIDPYDETLGREKAEGGL